MPRVLIVAESAGDREALAALVAGAEGISVVGAAEPGRALGSAASLRAHVLLVAGTANIASLAGRNREPAPDAATEGARLPGRRLGIVCIGEDDDPRRLRVNAVLRWGAPADVIAAALHAAAGGLVVVGATNEASIAPGSDRTYRAGGDPLTRRELEVLHMIAEGLPNKAIAAALGISAHTVKFHTASILAKLDAESRTEAVTNALRRGLIML